MEKWKHQNQNNLTAGNYSLTVTDLNGCSIQDSIVLNEPEELTLDLMILSNYYEQPVSCEGSEDGVVKVSASGGKPVRNYFEYYNSSTSNIQAYDKVLRYADKDIKETKVVQLQGDHVQFMVEYLIANDIDKSNIKIKG